MNFLKKLDKWRIAAPQIISQKLQKLKDKLNETDNLVTQVRPGLCHMPFPENHLISPLAEFITNKFGSNFFIWNLGQDNYETDQFLNQVSHTNIKNYPVFPLANLLLIAVNIKNWLKQQGNVAFVHCGKNKARSALLLSIYLYLDGWHEYLQDAMVQVNKLLLINKNETIFPSQHVFVRNCINLFNGFPINKKPLRLVRILMNKIPEMSESSNPSQQFSPYVQIFKLNEHLTTNDKYEIENESLTMNLNVELVDDILISIRHLNGPDDLYPCFRAILNTNFVTQNFIRISQTQLDLTKNIKPSPSFWIDFMFETTEGNTNSRLSQVWDEVKKVFNLNIQQQKYVPLAAPVQPVRKLQQQQLQQRLKQITNIGVSQQEHDASFAIDENSPQNSAITKPVQKQIQKLTLDQAPVAQPDEMDDYMRQLQESVDMS